MQSVTKDTLDNLSKKIYVNCACIDNNDKQLLEMINNIKLMKYRVTLQQDDIKSKELEYKEFNKAGELIKTSVYEDQIKLNRMVPFFDGEWMNQWPVSAPNTEVVPTEPMLKHIITFNNDNMSVCTSERDDTDAIEEDAPRLINAIEEVVHSHPLLIKTLNKTLLKKNWPYMRVKNTIKWVNSCKPLDKHISLRISYYDGLQVLAKYKRVHINELIKMNLKQFIGSVEKADTIVGRYYDWRGTD